MPRLRFAHSVAAMLLLAGQAAAQEAGSAQAPLVVTSGQAVVRRSPDVAFVSVAVESRAKTPRDAQSQNADASSAVQKRIAALDIPKDAVRTTGLSLNQEFDYLGGKQVPRDFVARNAVEIRIDTVARAGEVLDAAVAAGATAVGGIRFDLKDRASAEREALRLAVVDARARAEAIAAGAGRAVDRVIRIEETRSEMPVRPLAAMSARAEMAAVTDVEPGTIEIRAQVMFTASMK